MQKKKRVKTYIEGFDELLSGGIPEKHIVLLLGGPGTYKSSIALNMLTNNVVEDGQKKMGLYISLEESKESLEATAEGLGIKKWGEKNLLLADVAKIRLEQKESDKPTNWMNILEKYIHRRVKEGYNIVVIDSMSALYSLMDFQNPRKDIFRFFGFLKKLGITVFLITEDYEEEKYGKSGEDFLSDGIIRLKYRHISETEIQLWIRCVKMRQVDHTKNYYALLYSQGKFQIARIISERWK